MRMIYDKDNEYLDVTAPGTVEIQIRKDSDVVWVNVNGKCMVRLCRIGKLIVIDERENNGRTRRV